MQRAIQALQRQAPQSPEMAHLRSELGEVCWRLGNLQEARGQYQRAPILMEKRSEDASEIADLLRNLGDLCRRTKDWAGAAGFYARGLSVAQKNPGRGLLVSPFLIGLGQVAQARGDVAAAKQYFERVSQLKSETPATPEHLIGLGEIAQAAGDAATARPLFQQATESNLYWLGQAITAYVKLGSKKGRYPPMSSLELLRQSLGSVLQLMYHSTLGDLRCDTLFVQPGTAETSRVDSWLSNKKASEIASPAETVVLYEACPSGDGKRNVCFADGKVRQLTDAEWQRLKAASQVP
jgi:tetratricopeptide (TPR) repeat protein